MSRNGSGTYTLPSGNPVVSGTLIEASWANTTLSDIATALTGSLSRSAEGGMLAALRLYDGTSSVPGLAWGSETTTGWYRAGAGDMRLVITGSEVMKYLATGVAITGTLSASGNTTVGGTLAVTGATTLTGGITNNPTFSAGTANGVAYLNGSKVLTSGSALTFDGTNFATTGAIKTGATSSLGKVQLARYTDGAYVSEVRLAGTGAAPNYELYHGVAGDMLFYTAGTEKMRLTSTGLGIGTTSPSAILHTKATGNTLRLETASATGSGNNYIQFIGASGTKGYLGYVSGSSDNFYVYSVNAGSMLFGLNDSELMRLTSTGLGIGTSSPAYKLDVAGDIKIRSNDAFFIGDTSVYMARTSNGLYWGTNSTQRLTLDSSGNLGLGVTPSAWYTGYVASQVGVNGSVWANRTTADTNIVGMGSNQYLNSGATNRIYISNGFATRYEQASGVHSWYTAPSGTAGNAISFTQAMTLDASGNLGVGVTSPTAKLDVYQSASGEGTAARFKTNTTLIDLILNDTSSTTDYTRIRGASNTLQFFTNLTERARIDSSGAFIVGSTGTNRGVGNLSINPNTSNGAADITFNRNSTASTSYVVGFQNAGSTVGYIAYTNSATTYATSSDARLKDNVTDAPDSGAIIDRIRIRSFDWLADGSHQAFGGIAQELLQDAPEINGVCTPPNDGMMGVDWSKYVPLLIKEIQSLRARVTQLEGA